ncbi:hypothetical protein AQB9606_00325 [Aquabacterium sp. CECT 9606]|jgi:hypothetical protein|nr:hypothetical protein AQB9606_00325 [Aquabacterium sp. CECT 9606]
MVKTEPSASCIINTMISRLISPFAGPSTLAVWRYTVRQSADLSGLRALKKYR